MLPEQASGMGSGLGIWLDYYGVMRFISKISTVVLAVISSLLLVASAWAHTDVVSTSPIDGAVIDVTPAEISITFSEPPIEAGAAILLADVSGTQLPLGEVNFEGAKISAAAPIDLPAGDYVVTWRVSAEDGHALTGEFSFTFTGKVSVNDPNNTITTGSAETAVAIPVMDDEVTGNSGGTLWISLLAVLIASAIVAAIVASRKRQ